MNTEELISLLRKNARTSTEDLARELMLALQEDQRRMARIAVRPSITGICMSIRIRS